MEYVVFEDLADATETKVHTDSCTWYARRKPEATTVEWHGPFSSYAEAERVAVRIAVNKQYGVKACARCM